MAEIVPKRSRTSIYALDKSFESIVASFAPPIVGILAQNVYGYKPVPQESTGSQEIEIDRGNAEALGKALYTASIIPSIICLVIYSLLYCTYPRDRDIARINALAVAEAHDLETENRRSGGDYSQINVEEVDEKTRLLLR